MNRSAVAEGWQTSRLAPALEAHPGSGAGICHLLVAAGLAACSKAAWLPAVGYRAALRSRLVRRRGALAEAHDVSDLHGIWFARLCRELFAWPSRAGLGQALGRLVAWTPPDGAAEGCVFAMCSSPWGHVLAALAVRQPEIHVVIDGDWARRVRPSSVSDGARRLRELAAQLRDGHAAAVIADAFGARRACPATFFGRRVHASLLGARLAAAAGVPLIPVIFVWDRGRLLPRFGPARLVTRDETSHISATVDTLTFLEGEIRRTPAAWNRTLKPPESW